MSTTLYAVIVGRIFPCAEKTHHRSIWTGNATEKERRNESNMERPIIFDEGMDPCDPEEIDIDELLARLELEGEPSKLPELEGFY